ncbi:MAG: hypothetical protein ACE141_18155 [Bryobacteraceae bacterium]
MDSRHYVFSFVLRSLSEVPPDFDLPLHLDPLQAGVLLPQSDTDWLGRRKYPVRVLLLTKREVVVAAHPTAGEPLTRVPLERIGSVEHGRILLLGWITFSWAGGNVNLPYNTRTGGPVEAYMERFMDRWLPQPPYLHENGCRLIGKPPDLKFESAQSTELLPGETLLARFFRPASFEVRRLGVFRRTTWRAGDLLAVTARRLVWITERRKGQYEPYGTVSYSAPLNSIEDLRYSCAEGGGDLEIAVRSGRQWRVPFLDGERREVREFETILRGVLCAKSLNAKH